MARKAIPFRYGGRSSHLPSAGVISLTGSDGCEAEPGTLSHLRRPYRLRLVSALLLSRKSLPIFPISLLRADVRGVSRRKDR